MESIPTSTMMNTDDSTLTCADASISLAPSDSTAKTTQTSNLATVESACHVDMTTTQMLSGVSAPGVEGIALSGNGLIVDENIELTSEKYNTLFSTVLSLSKSCNWLLGDTLLLADRKWGNQYTAGKYEEAAAATGLSIGAIRNIVSTCKAFPREMRHENLSFTHHQEVARLKDNPDAQHEVLQQASDEKMSVKSLRKEITKRQHIQATTAPAETDDAPAADTSAEVEPKKRDVMGFDLLGLPERVSPDAPPMWDILKFHQWLKKTDAYEFDREKCEQALEMLEPILDFHADVKARLAELDEEQTS